MNMFQLIKETRKKLVKSRCIDADAEVWPIMQICSSNKIIYIYSSSFDQVFPRNTCDVFLLKCSFCPWLTC